jgi:hypothetical protein
MTHAPRLISALCLVVIVGCGAKRAPESGGAASRDLPAAAEVFERYLKATGVDPQNPPPTPGAMHMVADLSMPAQGMGGTVETWTVGQNMLTKMSISGIGELQMGLYEGVGWASDNLEGPRLLDGKERDQLSFDANPRGDLDWATRYTKVEVADVAPYADEDCFVVQATKPWGDVRTLYFSQDSGLLVGYEERVTMNLGSLNVSTQLSHYREIEGVLTATVMTSKTMGIEQVTTLVSLTTSPTELPSMAPPPEIQALIDEAGAQE